MSDNSDNIPNSTPFSLAITVPNLDSRAIVLQDKARVITPNGTGVVVSRRMKAPDYTEVAAYSVLLDYKVAQDAYHRYAGTVYPANLVNAIA